MDPKLLTESGWKAVLQKAKIKDNGLQRALAAYEKVDEDEHDDCLKAIASVSQLAGALKKAKEVAAVPTAVKYLSELIGAADAEQREIAKAKAAAEKAAAEKAAALKKTEAETKKQKQAAEATKVEAGESTDDEEEEEEEEQGDYAKRLFATYQKLKSSPDLAYQFIVCDAKPVVGVMVAKRITSKHKAELTKISGGSKRFLKIGTCRVDGGKFAFEMEKPPPGLARKIQFSIKNFTGKKLPIIVGTESAEDEEEQPGGGEQRQKPAVVEAPSAPPTEKEMEVLEDRRRDFKKARAAWVAVKIQAEVDLEKVKDGARTAYLADAKQFPKIAQGCKDIDTILDNLDDELRDTLGQYASTPLQNQGRLRDLSATAIEILDRYRSYVEGNPVMKAIDKKEFADVTIHAPIMKALGDLRKALS
jgi:hypothetical protein